MRNNRTHDLIVFGEDWGGLPSSTQHLIKHLAETHKVVWINSIGLRRPTLGWHDIKRVWHKLTARHSRDLTHKVTTAQQSEHIHIIYPRTLPAPRSRAGRWLAAQLLIAQINPVVKKIGLRAPILWTSLPTAVDLAGHLGESALVYYCGDDFSALAGVDHNTVSKREHELRHKADLIMVASERLMQKFQSPTYPTLSQLTQSQPPATPQLLTHGVDYSLFATPMPRAHDLPDDGRNIAGFYGSISEWLDLELLQTTIAQMPNWHFIFIGKVVVDVSQLTRFDNVTLLGERPHHALPSYSQYWTASLLPFVNNPQIQACNPLKLKEYLAAGRPIISTSFPAAQAFHGLVQIADNCDAMIAALWASEHLHPLPYFSNALRNTVAKHSWTARAKQVSAWLEVL
jgi:glycosyltransferase involved in cell wall biosynthesis